MATQEPYRDMSQGSSKRSIFDRWRESRNKPPSNESFLKRASNWWYQPIKYVLERAGFFVYAVVIFLVIAVVIFGGWNWISGAGAGQVAASELDIAAEKATNKIKVMAFLPLGLICLIS